MSVANRNPNTAISYGFRTAVTLHFASLLVLFFVLKNTLMGVQHDFVAAALTTLMAVVAVLFVADMATRKAEGRKHAKQVDVAVGCMWLIVVGFLYINSLRAGEIVLR